MSDGRTDNTRAFLYEVLGYVPPLTAEEVAHYRWLIGGLISGARQLAATHCPPSVPAALDEATELFDELLARIPVPEFEEVR